MRIAIFYSPTPLQMRNLRLQAIKKLAESGTARVIELGFGFGLGFRPRQADPLNCPSMRPMIFHSSQYSWKQLIPVWKDKAVTYTSDVFKNKLPQGDRVLSRSDIKSVQGLKR